MTQVSKPGWRGQSAAFGPLMLAVILTVLYKLGDGYVVGHLIHSDDKLISTLVYLTLGAATGLVINYILCQTPLGRVVDKSFTSIRGMSTNAHRTAIVAGVFSAIATGIYLWSLRTLDPSIVVPLTSLAVLYIAVVEAIRGKVKFSIVLPSIILVFAGVAVASFKETTDWAVSGEALLIVLLVYNVVSAVGELASKSGVDDSDAVSYGFWRFFWLTVSAIVIAVGISAMLGKLGEYTQLLWASLGAIPFIGLVMVVVFFANGWANRGLALSSATTKNLALTTQVVLSVFATAAVAIVWPEVFPSAPATTLQWALRLFGATLLMWGVLRLRNKA